MCDNDEECNPIVPGEITPKPLPKPESGGGGAEGRVVDELPDIGESGYIYLVLKEETKEGDIYDEWIWALQQDGTTYGWEHLGVTNEVVLEIDDAMSDTSENAVQNKVIKAYVDSAIPSVVQTTGTSTTDVMSQNAVTSMVFADPANTSRINIGKWTTNNGTNSINIGTSSRVDYDYDIAIGHGARVSGNKNYGISIGHMNGSLKGVFESGGIGIGYDATVELGANNSVALGRGSDVSGQYSVALGPYSSASSAGEVNIGSIYTSYGYNSSNYRLLTGVYDGQSAHDAATYGQVISYSAINGAGAPTTTTEGKYVGQLYYDTTNEAMYFLKTIDTTTTPATYTWETLGGGSSINVVQTTGTSTTDVMSQNAVTSTLYVDPSNKNKLALTTNSYRSSAGNHSTSLGTASLAWGANSIAIGDEADVRGSDAIGIGGGSTVGSNMASGSGAIAIGVNPQATRQNSIALGQTSISSANNTIAIGPLSYANAISCIAIGGQAVAKDNYAAVAIGANSLATGKGSVALGDSSSASQTGEMNIGSTDTDYGYNNSNYRLLTGLYDPQSDHDAATKGYVDATTSTTISARLNGLSIVSLTQTEYDALSTIDANTLYIITGA